MKAKQLAKIMKALSNENRLKLYLEIAKHEESDFEAQECNLSDIVKIFGLSPPTISHHLKPGGKNQQANPGSREAATGRDRR